MNIAQRLLLDMLRNDFFRLFLFPPTLWYLIKELGVDTVSGLTQGYDGIDMLFEVGKKIREQRMLLSYARTRFYRGLHQDGLITSSQLRRLENTTCIT